MIAIKRKISYVFRTDSGLRLRVRWDGYLSIDLYTGFIVNREKWDGDRCMRNTTHGVRKIPASVINRELDALEEKIETIFREFEVRNIVPTKEQFKASYSGGERLSNSHDFWKATVQFTIEGERDHQWAFNTVKSVRQVMNLLRAFDSGLTFGTLSERKLREFVAYQQKTKLSTKRYRNNQRGYSNAVIIKNCRVLK